MADEMILYVYPRLMRADAIIRWEEICDCEIDELTGLSSASCEQAIFPATGTRVQKLHLEELRKQVVEIATKNGFPDSRTPAKTRKFDIECGKLLYEEMSIIPGDAARSEVWSFITLSLLPDVARWRFPEAGSERFVGSASQRNALQRLWWRAFSLRESDGEPYRHLKNLPEDALVQIMERPSISSNGSVAKAVATVASRATEFVSKKNAEELVRKLCKAFRQRNTFVEHSGISRRNCEKQLTDLAKSLAEFHELD